MSVTMTKAEGVTVFTVTSDPQSVCPPLCQVFKSLCYSPACCSVSHHLRRIQKTSQSALGVVHIMVGLLNIGLGVILCASSSGSGYQMDEFFYPYWLGGMFILFGAFGILSEKCPSPCLVILNVILNLVGVAFAIAAIALYSMNVGQTDLWWMCRNDNNYDYHYHRHTTTPSPGKDMLMEKCLEAKEVAVILMRGINVVLIVLSVLEFCLVISSAVLGIKALCRRVEGENKKIVNPETYKPLLEEVSSNPKA